MPEKMSFEEMISKLDGACGRLIVASMNYPEIREAKEMITKVSLSLGEWAQELENKKEKPEIKEETIEALNLSVRACNVLKRNRVNTIEQLLNKSDNALMRMRGMGLKTFEEIKAKLEEIKR